MLFEKNVIESTSLAEKRHIMLAYASPTLRLRYA